MNLCRHPNVPVTSDSSLANVLFNLRMLVSTKGRPWKQIQIAILVSSSYIISKAQVTPHFIGKILFNLHLVELGYNINILKILLPWPS